MLIYIIIALLSLTLLFLDFFVKTKKVKMTFFWIAIILMILLATFRSLDIPDTIEYVKFYDSQINVPLFASNNSTFEFIFVLLARLCHLISHNYQFFFFIQALLINLIFYYLIKDSNHKLALYAIFSSFYLFYFTFIILRAGFAIMFFVAFLLNKKMKRYAFLLFALLCHRSTIFALLLYIFASMIKSFKLDSKGVVYIICMFFILKIVLPPTLIMKALHNAFSLFDSNTIILVKIKSYLLKSITEYSFDISFRYLVNLFFFIFFIKTFNIDMRNNKITILILLGFIIETYFGRQTMFGRITDFTNILIGFMPLVSFNILDQKKMLPTNLIFKLKVEKKYLFYITFLWVIINLTFMARIVLL